MLEEYDPELEDYPLPQGSEIAKYQMLIGCWNWTVTFGHFDVHSATTTLARYASYLTKSHMREELRLF